MTDILPPSPTDAPFGSYNWQDWYIKVRNAINSAASISWSQITNFTGSNLNQLATRNHADLQNVLPAGAQGHVPTGGATGQTLVKNSATTYDYSWATPTGGGGNTPVTTFQSTGSVNYIINTTAFQQLGSAAGNTGGLVQVSVPAVAGDVLEISCTFMVIDGGTTGIYLSMRYDTPTTQVTMGQWLTDMIASRTALFPVTLSIPYVVQSGDLSGGNILVKVMTAVTNTAASIGNDGNFAVRFWAKNFKH